LEGVLALIADFEWTDSLSQVALEAVYCEWVEGIISPRSFITLPGRFPHFNVEWLPNSFNHL